MDSTPAVSKSQAYTIVELRELMRAGGLRVPQFQRSFRWEAKDVRDLLDSILRGYPIGSLLLWQRPAPPERLTIGALRVDAPERQDALWVVDGQQRVTSLVNAVDPEGAQDPRFLLGYSLRHHEIVSGRRLDDPLVVPLPDLFDFGRALGWLASNPDAAKYAEHIQDVTGRLNRFTVPATVMTQADEKVLREVFDRINSRGEPLSAAEIFNALHGEPDAGRTTADIALSVDAQTRFGQLGEQVIIQALFVRRHPDITRDVHDEFSDSRRRVSDFPDEDEEQAYESTERALVAAVRFLQEHCGIPHLTFLPFRFQLLVLVRFFALFPTPHERNLELLTRWFWRTSTGADKLGISGSQTDLRAWAGRVVCSESASVQQLLDAARLPDAPQVPDLSVFRTTRSSSKMILAALWDRQPIDPETGEGLTRDALAEALEGETTPRAIVTDLVIPSALPNNAAVAAAKLISLRDRQDLLALLTPASDLTSLLLDKAMLDCLQHNDVDGFLSLRKDAMHRYLTDFLVVRTAWGQEDTPPLTDFVFDGDDAGGAS
ncbi:MULTISPECIES: DUF262 domain-containing protein [unclassified Actinomyces]|uniref:DUF262 domain-containing protein n=1 Tax=unclassified Actinomyces TaxID=2609248 RepID=UPI002017B0DD|nr:MULTISPECIES: DUF262 domain-containing protein [unclassified Actinomyces]MCL3777285.1 DUF262 domain-containing protein [Actinomyces sp. AC-20-1]MCL3789582.1 DUF262 domain-containing protein [Actinomyces sp. 187325]MCL3791867.1 DUF262 domain-containing protein [Actinomyces sp. 186855]MCL3793647.1 DUF262 domain-containing protein [Actinomyces sp. 217892]